MNHVDRRVRVTFDCATAEEVHARVTRQIKREGAFLAVEEKIPVGTVIAFEFLLGNGGVAASGRGVVRYLVPGETPSICLEFTEFDDVRSSRFLAGFGPGLPWIGEPLD